MWLEEKKEIQEWNDQKMPKVLLGYSGERLPGRSTQVQGREGGEEDEDSGERRIRNVIPHEVVTSIKEKTSAHEEAKTAAPTPAGQSLVRSGDCSQIENEEEEENEVWQTWKPNGEDEQWAEVLGAKLDGTKLFVGGTCAKKALELLVHERMSQGEGWKVKRREEERERMVH